MGEYGSIAPVCIQFLIDFDVVEVGLDGGRKRNRWLLLGKSRRDDPPLLGRPALEFENFAAAGFKDLRRAGACASTAALAVFIPLEVVGAILAAVPDKLALRSLRTG
jgi:hypothetical protein